MNKQSVGRWLATAVTHPWGLSDFIGASVAAVGMVAFVLAQGDMIDDPTAERIAGWASAAGLGFLLLARVAFAHQWMAIADLRADYNALLASHERASRRLRQFEVASEAAYSAIEVAIRGGQALGAKLPTVETLPSWMGALSDWNSRLRADIQPLLKPHQWQRIDYVKYNPNEYVHQVNPTHGDAWCQLNARIEELRKLHSEFGGLGPFPGVEG